MTVLSLITGNLGPDPGQVNRIIETLNSKAEKSTTINGKQLYNNITLDAIDIPYDSSGDVIITAVEVQNALSQLDAAVASSVSSFKAIRGTVANYAALPMASAHTDELWAVTNAQGVIWINRKDAGVYRSDGTNWLMVADLTTYDQASEIKNDSATVSGASTADALDALRALISADNFSWNEVTGATNMLVKNGYVANNSSLVVLTLPPNPVFGDYVRVVGKGAGGWKVAQNSGQTIHFGAQSTTTGVSGFLQSQTTFDCVELLCTTANSDWTQVSSQGNITIT